MLKNNDVASAKLVYRYYLEGQKGRYTDKDLGNFWTDIIHDIDWSDWDEKDKLEATQQFVPFIETLGGRSKKPLSLLAEKQKAWKEELEDEKETTSITEPPSMAETPSIAEPPSTTEDKYSWRQRVAPSKTRYANPDEYETPEEFEKGVKIGFSKYEEEQVNKRRESYSEKNICSFCKVDMMETTKLLCYYSTGDLDLALGDEVIVPFSRENKERPGIVVSIGKCYNSTYSV